MKNLRDKLLFTPGPLTTSASVKQAMLRDLGSRDTGFIEVIARIRSGLLKVAGLGPDSGYESILMQGSGTFSIEAVISSVMPKSGSLLVLINGAYGRRIVTIAERLGIPTLELSTPEDQPLVPEEVDRLLCKHPEVEMVAVIHCETTTGLMNPITEIGEVVRRHNKTYFVDAMSCFGVIPVEFEAASVDYMVSSANKCIEGVPGFAFVIARREALLASEGRARSVSLDLLAQLQGFEKNGQFRFTPPTHALLAFDQALSELFDEGGVGGRFARYEANHRALVEGMEQLGFCPVLDSAVQGPIITAFHYPEDSNFDFMEFYRRLNERGMAIYPGKLSQLDCFRIGSIGRLFPADMQNLLLAIRQVLLDMNVREISLAPAPPER